MEAFRAAVAVGVDQVETDIRITKDGEFVLIHDHTADRTTNGTGRIRDMTLKEVLSLDAGIKRGERFRGCRVPAFDEFLDYVVSVPGLTVDFELKEYPQDWDDDTAFRMCDRILKQIDDAGFTDRCVINTFSGELHEYIRDTYGNHFRQHVYFPCCNLGKLKRDPYQYAYCCCMFRGGFYNDIDLATKEECEMMASMGVQPWAGAGIRDERGVDAVIDRGCTLITCDNPDVILEILRKKGKHK
ncbi:MAG: hypothetical protein IJR83_08030 [Clostridia bacterium]|nr:hypothetical protein [Clostridia bacterium]